MANIFLPKRTTAEYKAEFNLLMAEAKRLNEDMRQTRIEIERLKAETKLIRDETHSLFSSAETEQQVQRRQ